jgi:hypothetical protein
VPAHDSGAAQCSRRSAPIVAMVMVGHETDDALAVGRRQAVAGVSQPSRKAVDPQATVGAEHDFHDDRIFQPPGLVRPMSEASSSSTCYRLNPFAGWRARRQRAGALDPRRTLPGQGRRVNRVGACGARRAAPRRYAIRRRQLKIYLRPHRHGIEFGAGIGCDHAARLFADHAMQVIEHEPNVSIDIPVQAHCSGPRFPMRPNSSR